MKFSERSLFLT